MTFPASFWRQALVGLTAFNALACASHHPTVLPGRPSEVVPPAVVTPSEEAAPFDLDALELMARGPDRLAYIPRTIDAEHPFVTVTLRNGASRPMTVSPLRVQFEVSRNGVRLPCNPPTGSDALSLPAVLAAGASLSRNVMMHCRLPVPGAYDVRVVLTGGPPERPRLREAGTFRTVVVAQNAHPSAIDRAPGLYAAMVGEPIIDPALPRRAGYRVILSAINVSASPVTISGASANVTAYAPSGEVACPKERVAIPTVGHIEPGAIRHAPFATSCIFRDEGTYLIEGEILWQGEVITLHPFEVRVSRDPRVMLPIP